MIAWLMIAAVALIPVAIAALVLAPLAGVLGSVAERDAGEGLFADPDA
jgi:hypothetical protein